MDNRYIGERILDEAAIATGVERVAALLNDNYQDAVVITVVPGGILFTADLTPGRWRTTICLLATACRGRINSVIFPLSRN